MIRPTRVKQSKVDSFDFQEGRYLTRNYQVVKRIGAGYEAEVYLVRETGTNILKAAKIFFPHRNVNNKALKFYAMKLHKLRHCNILIQYYTQEIFRYEGSSVTFLVSEYVEGEMLSEFLARQPGKRLGPYQAIHLLYSLVKGLEEIHKIREYHGDLHTDNVMVQRCGLEFDLKLLDFYRHSSPGPENIQEDIIQLIHVFYEALGGARHYPNQPDVVKHICSGLKRSLILDKFKSTRRLRDYLESMEWD